MMKHARGWLLAICFLATTAGTADAFFFWRWHNGTYRSSYYYPGWRYARSYDAPGWNYSSYYYPTWSSYYYPAGYSYAPAAYVAEPTHCAPAAVAQVAAQPKYAQPSAAPPSTKEPPIADSKKPIVTESHFSADKKEKKSITISKSQKGDCRVGFWNLTGRKLVLRVDGQGHYVARNKAITLDLGREFSYQIDGERFETVQVPDRKTSWEIVIR